MPLFSSLSLRDSTNAHHNKLEKSPHARRASLTSGRKASLRKAHAEGVEEASTRAIAGSASRLNQSNADANNESMPVPPLTPKSIRNDDYDEDELHNVVHHTLPPTPPAHDDPFARGGAGGYHVTPLNGAQTKDGSVRSSMTWRDYPDVVATKNKSNLHAAPIITATTHDANNPSSAAAGDNLRANPLGTGTVAGAAGLGMNSRAYGVDQRDESGDWASDAHQGHDFVAGGAERAIDIATARKKIQFAVEAELAADRALELARHAVHEARAAVKALEKQMNDEFQRAQARKMETDGVVKELEKLGRHDHPRTHDH
jgi:hypothetical protein